MPQSISGLLSFLAKVHDLRAQIEKQHPSRGEKVLLAPKELELSFKCHFSLQMLDRLNDWCKMEVSI